VTGCKKAQKAQKHGRVQGLVLRTIFPWQMKKNGDVSELPYAFILSLLRLFRKSFQSSGQRRIALAQ
jgi:hypothetical protein